MSAKQLVFEGPDPEQLLVEAWSKLGTDVRISEPLRVRKGGFLGFFAKLHYRIEVEPVTSGVAANVPPMVSTAGLLAPAPAAPRLVPDAGSTAGALDRLVEDTEDVFERGPTSRRSFDDVLETVASSLGDDPGAFAPLGRPAAPPGARQVDAYLATARSGGDQLGANEMSGDQMSGDPLGDDQMGGGRLLAGRAGAGRAADNRRSQEQLLAIGFPAALLASIPEAAPGRSYLETVLALLPEARPLPDVAGGLVALLGPLRESLEVARVLAGVLSDGPHEIAVATPGPSRSRLPAHLAAQDAIPDHLVVADPARAGALSPGWRRDRVAIVAIDTGAARSTTGWVRDMLTALRPTTVWSLASATSKSEDVAHFCREVGGVDALAVSDLTSTVTPAAILGAEIPIALLEGAPATTATWIAALAQRLAVQADSPGR